MFLRSRQKYKFTAALHAIAMWKSGCTHRLFDCLNHLGICLGVTAARTTVDKLRQAYDSMIVDWKSQIETALKEKETQHPPAGKPVSRSLGFGDSLERGESPPEISPSGMDGFAPGFSFSWDNVQIETTARHQSKERQNKFLLWALSFAVENRVSTCHLDDPEYPTIRPEQIPLQSFLPSQEDYSNVKNRMIIIVARILCQNFKYFEGGLGSVVPLHIGHTHERGMQKKSKIVNLRVLETNPSSTAGVNEIMETLQHYVLHRPDDSPYECVCYGDGLSVERMTDVKMGRASGMDEWERIEAFEPAPQEFHKRMLLMQDAMNELFTGKSAGDRKTLFHIKNFFLKKGVKKSVKDAFNHDSEFVRFVTEGYVCLFGQKIMGISLEEEDGPFSAEEDKWVYLQRVATEIVQDIWYGVPVENILEVLTANVPATQEDEKRDEDSSFTFCLCKEDTGEDMIECSNANCKNGLWFHLSCKEVGIVPEGDWWCSNTCKETKRSAFCLCKRYRPEMQMVQCKRKDDCPRGEWFHHECLKLDSRTPEGSLQELWIQKRQIQKNMVYNHSCAILWRGLHDLVRRDAERERDGEAMIGHWWMDMLDFWQKNHYKYLILGHRLLSGINGRLQPRLAEDLIWNRTANLRGGDGSNIALDLVNEFLNNDFKENLKHARGMYTPTHVARTAQMVGSLGKGIEKVYQKQVAATFSYDSAHSDKPDIRKEVLEFVEEYEEDRLVHIRPFRNIPIPQIFKTQLI